MRLIKLAIFTEMESCNTNNCYHTNKTHDVRVYLFGFEWKALKFTHKLYGMHERNEPTNNTK